MRSICAATVSILMLFAAWAGAAPQEGAVAAAEKARAAWSPEFRRALGFEDNTLWHAVEVTDAPKREGAHALKWGMHAKHSYILYSPAAPMDLSAFNRMSFWLHSSGADGETFCLVLASRHDPKVHSYYQTQITVNWKGWKKIDLHFRGFNRARNPVGWHQINSIMLTAGGWNQKPTDKPVWVLDDMQFTFDPGPYRPIIQYKQYVKPPTREAFLQKLHRAHPRLILLDEDLPRIKAFISQDPLGKEWFANVKQTAEMYYERKPQHHRLTDGRRLLSISRDVMNRMYHWGFMYRIDGDRKWLDRAVKEMEAVVQFPDWNPSHYLDTSEMMHAIGIGYDWFYNDLTEAQRKTIREGLWERGLRLTYAAYMGLKAEGQQNWRRVTNNWNFVCNGGSGLGAMAVLDEMPEKATDILHAGFQYIQIPIQHFEPDGAWWEGVNYWGYSLMYFTSYLCGLETAFGTDFGFIENLKDKGFSMAGDFPVYVSSPWGMPFNFADSGSGTKAMEHWSLFYLAARFRNPLYLDYQKRYTCGTLYDLLYYEPFEARLSMQDVALDKYFRETEVVTMRSSWTDPDALFVGVKCGRNGIAHAHQDLGSFIFYALGEKWAKDMGTEPQIYQGHRHHLRKESFYRMREEGHNTLVFNPDADFCQGLRADSKITRFETSPGDVLAVTDLSEAYEKYAQSVKRGYRLFHNRRAFLVQDEIRGEKANEIWWFSHGDPGAVYEVDASGRNVTIVRGKNQCRVSLLSPVGAKLLVMDARPLPTSPDPDIQKPNTGIKKLAVHLENTKDAIISVLYVPFGVFEKELEISVDVSPVASWKLGKP